MTNDASSFLSAIEQDPELRGKLKGSFNQILTAAQESGYSFSEADLWQELRSKWGISEGAHSTPDTCFFI